MELQNLFVTIFPTLGKWSFGYGSYDSNCNTLLSH